MNVNLSSQLVLRALAVACCLLLLACGGGGSLQLGAVPQGGGDTLAPADDIPAPGEPFPVNGAQTLPGTDAEPANKLVLEIPDVSKLAPGAEFEVSVAGVFAAEVYQGSMRLLYDPALLKPVQAVPGSLLLDDMVRLTSVGQNGYVPFSFTALPGHDSMAPGTGELLRVRFRLLQAGMNPQIRLQNDAEFLQLRDRNCRRLSFGLESRAGVQQ